jgi:hypothetical protein
MKDNDDIRKATMAAHNPQQLLDEVNQKNPTPFDSDGRRGNPNRHFYLYAKNHYQQDDMMEDLRAIMASYANIRSGSVRDWYILEKLLKLAYLHIENDQQFVKFVTSSFEVPADSATIAMIKACLIVLMFAKVKDIYYELGEPDPAILPVTQKPKEEQ